MLGKSFSKLFLNHCNQFNELRYWFCCCKDVIKHRFVLRVLSVDWHDGEIKFLLDLASTVTATREQLVINSICQHRAMFARCWLLRHRWSELGKHQNRIYEKMRSTKFSAIASESSQTSFICHRNLILMRNKYWDECENSRQEIAFRGIKFSFGCRLINIRDCTRIYLVFCWNSNACGLKGLWNFFPRFSNDT